MNNHGYQRIKKFVANIKGRLKQCVRGRAAKDDYCSSKAQTMTALDVAVYRKENFKS